MKAIYKHHMGFQSLNDRLPLANSYGNYNHQLNAESA